MVSRALYSLRVAEMLSRRCADASCIQQACAVASLQLQQQQQQPCLWAGSKRSQSVQGMGLSTSAYAGSVQGLKFVSRSGSVLQ